MRKWVLWGILNALLVSCAVFPLSIPSDYAVSLRIQRKDGWWICGGTKVGPHTILTATHCVIKQTQLVINGEPVPVLHIAADSNDHALVVLGTTFSSWARLGPRPSMSARVFIYGETTGNFLFRNGYVAGYDHDSSMVLDMTVWFGDSGSGVFNSRGQLVGVINSKPKEPFALGYAYPLTFSPDQWALAE